jgi:hypothetical protein
MGVDVKRIQDNETTGSNSRGDYTFLDIPAFLAKQPSRFDAPPTSAADAYRGIRETMFGAYVQDDFKVNQRLTLNLGLRYELLTDPYEVNGIMANLFNISDLSTTKEKDHFVAVAKKDFQPRVGFAWQADASGKTVVRAGFGIFHDHILPFSIVANASAPSLRHYTQRPGSEDRLCSRLSLDLNVTSALSAASIRRCYL